MRVKKTALLTGWMVATAAVAQVPATQPVSPAADVLVVPFSTLGDPSRDWAGRGVQQNLLTDLARANLRPASVDKPMDPAAAAKTAAAAGIRFVVVGSVQTSDHQLRMTGQIVDAETGKTVGGVSATGNEKDLFALEDAVSEQAIATISKSTGGRASAVVAETNKPARPLAEGLQQPAVAVAVAPPAATVPGAYDGSALQRYVDSNRSPSVDYRQQLVDTTNRNTFGSYNNFGGFGFGGFGYGLGGYGLGFGYGGFAGGYGGFGGRSGFAGGGYGYGGRHGQFSAR